MSHQWNVNLLCIQYATDLRRTPLGTGSTKFREATQPSAQEYFLIGASRFGVYRSPLLLLYDKPFLVLLYPLLSTQFFLPILLSPFTVLLNTVVRIHFRLGIRLTQLFSFFKWNLYITTHTVNPFYSKYSSPYPHLKNLKSILPFLLQSPIPHPYNRILHAYRFTTLFLISKSMLLKNIIFL